MNKHDKMEELKNKILKAISKAEAFADENDLGFSLDIEYGMGGWYESGQWYASSQSC